MSEGKNQKTSCRDIDILKISDTTSLKADREDWGGLPKTLAKHRENESQRDNWHQGSRDTKQTNESPLNPLKIEGKLINTHQNSSRNHQGSSRISQNHFLIHFATKSNTNPKGRPRPARDHESNSNSQSVVTLVYGTTNTVYGTTNTDAGVGIGMKNGDSKN